MASSVSTQAIRAVSLSGPLLNLRPGWNRLSDQFYAIMTKSPTFVDSTLAPSPILMWFRTTLIKVNGAWYVAEFAADVSQMNDLECGMVSTDVSDVLTLAHNYVVDLGALGIHEVAPPPGASSGEASSSSSTRRQPRVPSLQPLADLHDAPGWQPDIPSGVAMVKSMLHPMWVMLLWMLPLLLQVRLKRWWMRDQNWMSHSQFWLMGLHWIRHFLLQQSEVLAVPWV